MGRAARSAWIHLLPKFAYFPEANRARVSASSAMMEMVLILATMAQKFRFRLQPGATVLDSSPQASLTFRVCVLR
jgi:hypothetical protein